MTWTVNLVVHDGLRAEEDRSQVERSCHTYYAYLSKAVILRYSDATPFVSAVMQDKREGEFNCHESVPY